MGKYPSGYIYELNCESDNATNKRKRRVSVRRFMPILVLPPKAITDARQTSTNSSAHAVTAQIIETKLSSNELFEHFSKQIEAQQWKNDATWSGMNTEGATWTRQIDNDLQLVGNFSIVSLNQAEYRIEFWLISKNDRYL